MRLLLLLSLFGCPDEPATPDAGDAGAADVSAPVLVFEAEALAGPSLRFGNAALTAGELALDVIGHELADVHGVTFRVEYDPAVLSFTAFEKGAGATRTSLEEIVEVRPGLLLVVLAQIGPIGGFPIDGAPIGRLTFTRGADVETSLRIRRGAALDSRGVEIPFRSGGGALVFR